MASTTAKRHRMRCARNARGCGRRFTLKRHPLKYKRAIKCPHCGCAEVADVEQHRRDELAAQERCVCYMYPFPHRAGSLRMCQSHPLADVEPTDEEIADYEACIATPRSGAM